MVPVIFRGFCEFLVDAAEDQPQLNVSSRQRRC